jgi:hypothetical protein
MATTGVLDQRSKGSKSRSKSGCFEPEYLTCPQFPDFFDLSPNFRTFPNPDSDLRRLFPDPAGDPNGVPAADPGHAHVRQGVRLNLYSSGQCAPCRCLCCAGGRIPQQLRLGFRLWDRCYPDHVNHHGALFLCRHSRMALEHRPDDRLVRPAGSGGNFILSLECPENSFMEAGCPS